MGKFLAIVIIAGVIVGAGIYIYSTDSGIFRGGPEGKIWRPPVTSPEIKIRPSNPPPSASQNSNNSFWELPTSPFEIKNGASSPPSSGTQGTKKPPVSSTSSPTSSIQLQYLPNISDSEIPKGFTRSRLSPYFKQVKISSVSQGRSNYPAQITLYTSYSSSKDKQKINITNWQIRSNKQQITVPQAVRAYDPRALAASEDIALEQSHYVNLYSTFSPAGRNFRLNKCIGYLNESITFKPALPRNCPRVSRSDISTFEGSCQNFINSISTCKIPSANEVNVLNNACRDFISNHFNYASCYDNYYKDKDFLSSEWWAWVSRNILDPSHDRLLLYDKQGLLVYEYTY